MYLAKKNSVIATFVSVALLLFALLVTAIHSQKCSLLQSRILDNAPTESMHTADNPDIDTYGHNRTHVQSLLKGLERIPEAEQALHLKKVGTDYKSIWMGPIEVNLVLRYLNNRTSYLEWGSGGSTFNFPQFVPNAISIEHNEAWCGTVRAKIAANPSLHHIQFHCVPVERGHMGWGKKSPFEEGSYIEFSEYVDHVDKVGRQYFDFVLIDGRARMDCAIKALSYIDQQSVVVVHDAERIWTSKRYESVLTYYSIADAVGGYGKQGLAVLKRRKEFDYLEGEHAMVAKLLREKHDM